MKILTNESDIREGCNNGRWSSYTADQLAQDLQELAALRAAAEKMADVIQWAIDDKTFGYIDEGKSAIAEYEALK